MNTISAIAQHLSLALKPLQEAVSSPERFAQFFYGLGWQVESVPSSYITLGNQVTVITDRIIDLGENPESANYQELVIAVKRVFETITNLTEVPAGIIDTPDFINEVPKRLFEFLLAEYLASTVPTTYNFFKVTNVIELNYHESTPSRPSFTQTKINWKEIPKIVTEFDQLPEKVYGWGSSDFEIELLFDHLLELFLAIGASVSLQLLPNDITRRYSGLPEEELPDTPSDSEIRNVLKIALAFININGEDRDLGLHLLEYPSKDGNNPGLILQPNLPSEIGTELRIREDLKLIIEGGSNIASLFGIIIRPEGVEVTYPYADGGELPKFGFHTGLAYSPTLSTVLLGNPEGARLQLDGANVDFYFDLTSVEPEVRFGFDLVELAFIVQSGEGDGFLNKILGDGQIAAGLTLGIDISNRTGFNFRGGGGFEIAMYPNLNLGILEIDRILIALKLNLTNNTELKLEAGMDIRTILGPLTVVIENTGFKVSADFNDNGNLGPFNLSTGFKPPNGLGLSIDAGAVKGGGYLRFDTDREEYAGALELVFSEWIALKAIGLVTTKMPDGSKGFSMVIIISVEFGSGIQLGFGFTLLGVGGLLGLNRTVNIEPLKDGVRTGGVESVLFPQDIVANAPRIISDLRQFFPVQEGQFLIGPMAKIGYGTPTLASLSLGVIIEFPDVSITILGVLKVILPDERADVLRLQVNFLGRVEPSNQLLWFYAELFDSRVLWITLEGGMGLLVNWGDNSNFVVSVGGFHPRYTPPPLPFNVPPRIAANILNESLAKIRIEGYFAVTSNTVQFGARAELFFGFSALKVEGHLGFDALFQFDPFYFIFEFSVKLGVKVFGFGLFSISVSGLLEGPTKWHIKGKAKWKITWLGPTIRVNINETWGEERQTELPPIEVMPLIQREFEALSNWEAVVPNNNSLSVSLRQLGTSEEDQLVLHPVGSLRIRQRKLPLDLKLDKVGNQRPADVNKLSVAASVAGADLSPSPVKDKFARGEFRNLSEAQKLSSPGFESYNSGIEISIEDAAIRTSQAVTREVCYETIIIDNNFKRHAFNIYDAIQTLFVNLYATLFRHHLKGNAVTKSSLSKHQRIQLQPRETVIRVQPNQYSVAYQADNIAINDDAMQFASQAEAIDYMQSQAEGNPSAIAQMHVIPNTELNTAA